MRRVILITGLVILLAAAASASFTANDPSSQISNARIIGLGGAYVAVADDAASIYGNPAGLAAISKPQVSSMFGKFIDEYNYTALGLVYPTKYGVIGLGYSGSSIDGAPVTRIKAGTENSPQPLYEADPAQGSVGNTNSVLIASYGTIVRNVVKAGAKVKVFQNNLSGGGISNGNGTGLDLDLGVQVEPKEWLKVGLLAQNVLPASMGGQISYPGGHTESYPASITIGSAVKVPGQELLVALDIKSSLSEKNPSTAHLGIEWKPAPLLAVRAGIDQNNLSAGVGINIKGFRFDYGYHQFASAPGVSNNYFSISYGLPAPEKKKETKELVEPAPKLELIRFNDLPETHWAYNQISLLATQGIVKGYPDKTFRPEGKISRAELTALLIKTSDAKLEAGRPIFKDVSAKHWAYNQIYTAAKTNLVNGYPGYSFKPKKNINRAEGLVMISRYSDIQPIKYVKTFPNKDLTRAEVVEMLFKTPKIQSILANGILKGRGDRLAAKK